jgi:hypothetical protein
MIIEKNKSKINDSISENNTISSRLKKDLDTSISNYKKNKTTISLQDIFKKLGYSF